MKAFKITTDDVGYNSVTKKDIGKYLVSINGCNYILKSQLDVDCLKARLSVPHWLHGVNLRHNKPSNRFWLTYDGKTKRVSADTALLLQLYAEGDDKYFDDESVQCSMLHLREAIIERFI